MREELVLTDESIIKQLLTDGRVPIIDQHVMIQGEDTKVVRIDIPPVGAKFKESKMSIVRNHPEEDDQIYEFSDPTGKSLGSAETYMLSLADANIMIGYMNTIAQELGLTS
jgi:hypothetical protein